MLLRVVSVELVKSVVFLWQQFTPKRLLMQTMLTVDMRYTVSLHTVKTLSSYVLLCSV